MTTITFLGAAEQVTGSCYLIKTSHSSILLECGMFQGSPDTEKNNSLPFAFDPRAIDAVILSHAHLDHSGLLPRLAREHFTGKIFTSHATADLLEIMLTDAAFLEMKDTEWENRRRQRAGKEPLQPLFTIDDVQTALSLREPVDNDTHVEITRDIKLRFRTAGHIIGSCIVELWIEDSGKTVKLVFSGDLGNHCSPLLRDPEFIHDADILLLETTYGNRDHRSLSETLGEFEEALVAADENNGNVLIPSFAVGRTQDIIYWLGEFYRRGRLRQHQVFIDSPMAIKASEVYLKYTHLFNDDDPEFRSRIGNGWNAWLPTLKYTRETQESMALNKIRHGAIIIAGSGMCTGGRIRHHLKHNLWNRRAHVIITGFQAYGTAGRRLVDGAQHLTIFGEEIAVKANIHTLGGFSAHAGQTQLFDWLDHFSPDRPRLFLVHGEKQSQLDFQAQLLRQTGWRADIPRQGENVEL